MQEPPRPAFTREELSGLRRLGAGAGVGLAGGICSLILPFAFLWLASENPGGFFSYGTTLVRTISILVLAGAILFVLSLFLYRRGFAAFRHVDPRFATASVLCLVGSIGFLLLLVTAVLLFGASSEFVTCIHGAPSHALTCLSSSAPLGAYAGLAGFVLGWVGGLGIVLGVRLSGRRYRRTGISAGSFLYAVLLLVLVGPLVAALYAFPYAVYLLAAAPFLLVLAPGLVLGGVLRVPSWSSAH